MLAVAVTNEDQVFTKPLYFENNQWSLACVLIFKFERLLDAMHKSYIVNSWPNIR